MTLLIKYNKNALLRPCLHLDVPVYELVLLYGVGAVLFVGRGIVALIDDQI